MPSNYSIRIIFTVLSVIGFALLPLLSIRLLPTSKAYQLTVNYNWPNAAPSVIEQAVTTPLEGALNLVNGVKKIQSVSRKGSGYIQLDLAKTVDIAMLRFEIATKIRQLYPKLPEGLSYPTISINNPEKTEAERPILTYSLSGLDNSVNLYRYAQETLSPQLALTAGIQHIEVLGGNQLEWVIQYDAVLCQTMGVKRAAIYQALQELFQSTALGLVEGSGNSFFVRLGRIPPPSSLSIFFPEESIAALQRGKNIVPKATSNSNSNFNTGVSARELGQLAIQKVGQRIIYLEDIATIQLVEAPPRSHYRINGQNSIRLLFYAEQQVNTIQLAKGIKANIAVLQSGLPTSYQLFLDDDATEFLAEELDKIGQRTFFSLGILLFFVLLLYRSFRHLGIILGSLIANLGIAFIFYYWLEVELHLYALAGITVSFGLIIDNTLVMVHHLRQQQNLRIFPALLAATLTTLAALIIIFFLPDEWQVNLVEFAKVIGINLGVSLLVAGVLIPALVKSQKPSPHHPSKAGVISSNKLIKNLHSNDNLNNFQNLRRLVRWQHRYQQILSFSLNWRKSIVTLIILVFGLPVFMLPNKIDNWDWYNQTLGSEWYVENVKPSVNKWLGGTLRLFVWYVYEGANYQQPSETVLYIQGSMPNGTTLAQMNAVYEQIDAYLGQFDVEIKQYVSNVYSGQYAQTQIYFKDGYELSFPHQLKSRLIAFSINLGGVEWNVYGVGKGFSNSSGSMPPRYRLKMNGYNKPQLNEQAQRMAQKLEVHPRVKKVNTEANIEWWTKDLYEYELTLDKRRLAEQQILPIQIQPIFDNFNRAVYPNLYTPQQTGVRLVSQSLATNDLWVLQNRPIPIDSQFVNFKAISQLSKQKVAGAIHKEDQQYIQLLEWEYTGSGRFGDKHLNKCKAEMEKELPLGYKMENAQQGFWQQKTQKQYSLFLLIIGLIFFICAVQFESFRQAFAIVLLIPISFIGIFLTFYCFDFNFDQGGYTSFILLSGLVVNGLILLINDYNHYRKKYPHRSFINNYSKAFLHKITPVLLTIISTALGLIPFLWHGQQEVFWFSLAVGTIGGLLFSVLVLVFFIPLFLRK
ncbi:MAG: efflux RND transporter permease subunit [Saprospiraceae bacterium]